MGCSGALVYGEYFPNMFFYCYHMCVRKIMDIGKNRKTGAVIEGGLGGI